MVRMTQRQYTIIHAKYWHPGIPLAKVSKVVTDNGRNMVKAFQEAFQFASMQDSKVISDDSEECGNTFAYLDANLEESFVEASDYDIDVEIMEFESEEQEVNAAFQGLERLSCFAHLLQCCLHKLNKSTFASPSRKAAFQLMESFSHSSKLTQLLVKKSGKKLLTACKTHWSYNCLTLEHLLELRTAVTQVTEELQTINNLTNSQWSDIERYVNFTKPFANITYSIEGNLYTTLSEIIPGLLRLRHHLNEVKNVIELKIAAADLLIEIEQRFSFVLDPKCSKFNPIYVVAIAVVPRYHLILNDDQLAAAKNEILRLLVEAINWEEAPRERPEEHTLEFDPVEALIQQKQQQLEQLHHNPAAEELSSYLGSNHAIDRKAVLLLYWKDHEGVYKNLASLAEDILAIPATSAPVERIFSQASIAISGRRGRLSGKQLEREVMLNMNKTFFDLQA